MENFEIEIKKIEFDLYGYSFVNGIVIRDEVTHKFSFEYNIIDEDTDFMFDFELLEIQEEIEECIDQWLSYSKDFHEVIGEYKKTISRLNEKIGKREFEKIISQEWQEEEW